MYSKSDMASRYLNVNGYTSRGFNDGNQSHYCPRTGVPEIRDLLYRPFYFSTVLLTHIYVFALLIALSQDLRFAINF
jgi:hypothetical protein